MCGCCGWIGSPWPGIVVGITFGRSPPLSMAGCCGRDWRCGNGNVDAGECCIGSIPWFAA
jgi:hypothetical protein